MSAELNWMDKASFERIIRGFGFVLVVSSFSFVAALIWSHREVLSVWRPDVTDVLLLLFAALSYSAAGILLARTWYELLLYLGETGVTASDVFHVYGRSQIAKYIPGNVAQVFGRHVLGLQCGLSNAVLVLSSILELGSLLFVASLISVIGFFLNPMSTEYSSIIPMILLTGGLIIGTLVLLAIGWRAVKHRWPAATLRLQRSSPHALLRILMMYFVFFAISGSIFLLIGFVVTKEYDFLSQWMGVIGIVALAWMGGVITPGAPSGIGIREGILTVGLTNIAPVEDVLLAVVLFRLVTILGDVFYYFGAVIIPLKNR